MHRLFFKTATENAVLWVQLRQWSTVHYSPLRQLDFPSTSPAHDQKTCPHTTNSRYLAAQPKCVATHMQQSFSAVNPLLSKTPLSPLCGSSLPITANRFQFHGRILLVKLRASTS